MKRIYTIGTSNRSIEDFLKILHSYKISTLVDIRRFPTSRQSHFKKENLKTFCSEAGITYRWLGENLGGFRDDGYPIYMQTNTYLEGLKMLEQVAQKEMTAFCCAERHPSGCHRRFVAKSLQEKGWQVVHILDLAETWDSHQLTLF
jgi:uncharacterized protein (DUF488 family)